MDYLQIGDESGKVLPGNLLASEGRAQIDKPRIRMWRRRLARERLQNYGMRWPVVSDQKIRVLRTATGPGPVWPAKSLILGMTTGRVSRL